MTDKTVHEHPETSVCTAFATGGNISAATNVDGTTYTAFAAKSAKRLLIVNNTGTEIEVQQDAAGDALPIPDGTAIELYGFGGDTSNLAVRRSDNGTTSVTVYARWES